MAKAHRRYSNIDQLMIHGAIIEEPDRIQNEIVYYYKRLYTETISGDLLANICKSQS